MILFSPYAEQTKGELLVALRHVLPASGLVCELGSGSGQHVAYFATALPALRWQPSDRDPAVRMQDEFVFDQFPVPAAPELSVHGFQTLRPRDPTSYPIYTFRVIDARYRTAVLEVAVETSDYAKERGAPFVISLLDGTRYQALGTSAELPPYPELKSTVLELVTTTLAARAKAN